MSIHGKPVAIDRVEAGLAHIIHATYQGKKYEIRLNLSVLGLYIAPGQGTNPSQPNFSVQAGSVLMIEAEDEGGAN